MMAVIACPHRPPCAACPRYGEGGIAAGAHTLLDALARASGLAAVQVFSGEITAFRLRARLAIRGRVGSPKIGLFEPGTHRVVHNPNCRIQHPLINRVASVVRRVLAELRTSCYSDGAHLGLARYLQVVIERNSQTAQVVLVGNCATAEPLAAALDLIRARLGDELHSLWFNGNVERGNAILGADFQPWGGAEAVVEHFGGAGVHYPPGAFGQSNLEAAQEIIQYVRARIPQRTQVAEFYAGVGAIGLSILNSVAGIRMNEVSPHSLHGLALGIDRLDGDARSKISVIPGAAGESAAAASGMQVVIADPPRRGLDAQLRQYLSENAPDHFIYVSCGLQSFLADCAALTASGALRLASLAAFNLMPFTEHVETVAFFERT